MLHGEIQVALQTNFDWMKERSGKGGKPCTMDHSGKKGSKKVEPPRIELYMYSLNQEFPVGKGHASFLKRHSEVKADVTGDLMGIETVESEVFRLPVMDWSVQWISNQWITNYTKLAGMGLREDVDPMYTAIVRKEDFGAILFEPRSDRVFKLNKSGLALYYELRIAYQRGNRDFENFTSELFSEHDVACFVAFLKGAGLWIPQ
ncbi:hypothetical protein ACFYU8_13525 [Brevibacillus sp. NPDC003359]